MVRAASQRQILYDLLDMCSLRKKKKNTEKPAHECKEWIGGCQRLVLGCVCEKWVNFLVF